jgi:hypothetical protein
VSEIKFAGTLWSPDPKMGSWTFLKIPKTASAKLGTKGMVKVTGTINGFPFTTSAQPDGSGAHVITVNKTMRDGAKAQMGDRVDVVLAPAAATKDPKIPNDLQRALKASTKATGQWKDITPRAREEWIEWIVGAKQEATRERRVSKVVERLSNGARRFYDKDK